MERLISLLTEQPDSVIEDMKRANVTYGYEQLVKNILNN